MAAFMVPNRGDGDDQARSIIRQETGDNGEARNQEQYSMNNYYAEGQIVSLRQNNLNINPRQDQYSEDDGLLQRLRQPQPNEVLLRNEVAALPQRLREQLSDEVKCLMCKSNIRDAVIRDCGHLILCQKCLLKLVHCPSCGRKIRAWSVASWFS
ncbi:baculoviral IAP repeat-containing protein 7-B-like [Ruditapes philippinarum]|uniref:baculoviral IAP repeat-containing protein 7-B-like n=1 Tax=Ruditapes philippinarum TaxID=129788 RepID=UPI00295B0135|nr:baculoviral IAP repeat-containing protein 7-B-like [Ruditapes philippinarum]